MKLRLLIAMLAIALPAALCAQQYEGEHYVLNSTGLHIAKTPASGVCQKPTNNNPQMMKVEKNANGYYTFQAPDGTYLSKGGTNKWNTTFVQSADASEAQFIIEPDNNLIKIKCRANNLYLGINDTNDGTYVFCDKDGKSPLHMWFLADEVDAQVPSSALNVIVNPAARRQLHEGWGVSLCWWANMCGKWSDEKIDEIVDYLVSPEHLNYNIFRYNIGGGDDPENHNCTPHHMGSGKGLRAEMPGFKAYEDSEYDWDADSAQVKIMRKIKEKRPDAIFEAFSNSAPWWMTYSGCCSGNNSAGSDNLKPEYYQAFAQYLVDVCKHHKEAYGIEFATLEPFNEPMTSYWGRNGGQEGCHFSVNSMIAFIKVLYPVLQESGLNTVISASDETDISQSVKDFDAFKKADVLKYLGQWNVHTYSANNAARAKTSAQCTDLGIKLWMSEVGAGGSGIAGNLSLAQKLIDDMRYIQPAAWVDWQYIEEGNDQWCLIQGNFTTQKYRLVNNFYVRQHFSKYIKPGYTILTSTNPYTLAATSPDRDELVLVAINTVGTPLDLVFDLGMYDDVKDATVALYSTDNKYMQPLDCTLSDKKQLSLTLPTLSICTIVLPVTEKEGFDNSLVDGEKYLILPRNSANLAISEAGENVALASINLSPKQIWTVAENDGKVTFTNGDNNIITATSVYSLSLSNAPADVQAFTVTPIGAGYSKIEATIDGKLKAFDLEGEGDGAGVKVGMWEYGTENTAIHRQFAFARLTESALSGLRQTLADSKNTCQAAAVNTGHGIISIVKTTPKPATASIATLDGRTVYSAPLADTAQVPMPRGTYVVMVKACGAATAKVVTVK